MRTIPALSLCFLFTTLPACHHVQSSHSTRFVGAPEAEPRSSDCAMRDVVAEDATPDHRDLGHVVVSCKSHLGEVTPSCWDEVRRLACEDGAEFVHDRRMTFDGRKVTVRVTTAIVGKAAHRHDSD
jgi:hypothetical protein